MKQVHETVVLAFENDEHRRYATLCGNFGFSLRIDSQLNVGMVFQHPRGFMVRLDVQDDTTTHAIYEPTLMVVKSGTPSADHTRREWPRLEDYDIPMYPGYYSELEWEWLQDDDPSDFEMLRRELYIWTKVRPHRLNTRAIDQYTLLVPHQRPHDEDI